MTALVAVGLIAGTYGWFLITLGMHIERTKWETGPLAPVIDLDRARRHPPEHHRPARHVRPVHQSVHPSMVLFDFEEGA